MSILAPVAPRDGVIGFSSSKKLCDASRSIPQDLRLCRSCLHFWRLGWEGSRPAGSRKSFPVC